MAKNLARSDIWEAHSGRKTEVVLPLSHRHDRIATESEENLAEYTPPPADEHWPLARVLALQPTETLYGPSWDDVRRDFEENHPTVLSALRDDFQQRGMVTPVHVNRERGTVENGHHRVLAAQDVGYDPVPVIFKGGEERDWEWDPDTRQHKPYEDDFHEGAVDLRGEHGSYRCPNCGGQMRQDTGECYRCGYTYGREGVETPNGEWGGFQQEWTHDPRKVTPYLPPVNQVGREKQGAESPIQLIDQGFGLAGNDHDKLFGSVGPSHPVFYNRDTRQVWKGAPGQYHHESIEQNHDLQNHLHGWGIFDPPPGMYMGRLLNKDNGAEMHWYKHPLDEEKTQIHDLLGTAERHQPNYDADDVWEPTPTPPPVAAPPSPMSFPSSMRNFLTGATGPIRVQLQPNDDDFTMPMYNWRIPFSYSRADATVHVGEPATIHGSLPRGNYPRFDGMIALQSHQHEHGYTPGMAWLDVDRYAAPTSEEHQQIQQALALHYPEAAQNFIPKEHDFDDDDLWDDEPSDVPMQTRYQGDGLRLGWVDEVEDHETAFARVWNNR